MNKEMTLIDSSEAAKLMTVEGWVSRYGRFFGSNEEAARLDGCTHKYCSNCGAVIPKVSWKLCNGCREKSRKKVYENRPRQEWDGDTPLYSDSCDEYFFSEDEVRDFIEERGIKLTDLDLLICTPNRFSEIDADFFTDELPDDGDIPPALLDAMEVFNKAVRAQPPASWSAGKYAATGVLGDES